MHDNYARLRVGREEHALQFFDSRDAEETLRVVSGMLGEAAMLGRDARVTIYKRDALSPSLRAQTFHIGTWQCPKCRKEAEDCKCRDDARAAA